MADTKVTALTELTTPAGVDLLYIVDDPAGTPLSRKCTVANFLGEIATQLRSTLNGAVSAPAVTFTGSAYTGGSATTTKPLVLIEPTGATSTGWSTSGTMLGVNAASGFSGNLLDVQLNGRSYVRVRDDYGVALHLDETQSNNIKIFAGFGIQLNGTAARYVAWNSDTFLFRDAANTLALRNSTNAQTFRTYGTYTDASNYRRVAISMTTDGVASIAPEGAGTGASGNVLHISGLPTSNPGPGILWNNAGTPAIGT